MPKRFAKRRYTTQETAEMLGCTKNDIAYMVKTKVLTPCPGSEHKYFFSDETLGRYLGYPEYTQPMFNDNFVSQVAQQLAELLTPVLKGTP